MQRPNKKTFIAIVLRLAFAICFGLIIQHFSLDYLEFYSFDWRLRNRPPISPSGNIELVLTKLSTVKRFSGPPTLKEVSQLIGKVEDGNPFAVVYVSDFTKLKGTSQNKNDFFHLSSSYSNIYQVFNLPELKDAQKQTLSYPFNKVHLTPGPKTMDDHKFSKDGVTRRLLVQYQGQNLLHTQLASHYNPSILDIHKVRGTFPIYDSIQVRIDYAPLGSYPSSIFEEVYDGKISSERFKNKIVVIGNDTLADADDYVFSPMARTTYLTSLAEMHANMFDTLIRNSAPVKAPDWLSTLLTILIAIITVEVVLTMKPLKGILVLLGLSGIYAVIAYLAFWPLGIWMDVAHPFLAIFLCYYFFIPYRLIVESRRSWEYFQKHKLLSEVEQLKTNFIGMMSHDLKTPLARIQGMTDIIQKDKNQISTPQREALDTIKQSSEDLLKFISTILNYAKIESQGVELHFQSRDINEILKEVIKKHEFLARLKHIQLIAELEPLFSTKADPELLRQVFSNLVENAIKYSPEKSKVLISSEEVDGNIVVQIADQGMGIPADELSNIFMKFFRSKYAKTSPIKGSGLGLYLAKYFVELHQGRIICESTPGQGSTFTVELPVKS